MKEIDRLFQHIGVKDPLLKITYGLLAFAISLVPLGFLWKAVESMFH